MISKTVKYILGILRSGFAGIKAKNIYIGHDTKIKNGNLINFGENVIIRPFAQIWVNSRSSIGKGTEIGERCRFSVTNSLSIGEDVLFSPNVYITDADHAYENINEPVIKQGIVETDCTIKIGDGSYVGINSVIIGCSIGKHCIIGANSVVTKNIPDYSVAVGTPAQVIKHYDFEKGKWVKESN